MKTYQDVCICATCGTSLANAENAYCKNGHDDWLERGDDVEIYIKASKNTGISIGELVKELDRLHMAQMLKKKHSP